MPVITVGAGEVGSNIAAGPAESRDVTVVDAPPETVDERTDASDTPAIEGDGTSSELSEDPGFSEADVLIALSADTLDTRTGSEDAFGSVQACSRTVAVADERRRGNLFETVGIDVAFDPREDTAEGTGRLTQGGTIENLSLSEGQQADALEIEGGEEGALAGRPIRERVGNLSSAVGIESSSLVETRSSNPGIASYCSCLQTSSLPS